MKILINNRFFRIKSAVFYYKNYEVGLWEKARISISSREHRYGFFRGYGHLLLTTDLKKEEALLCHFFTEDQIHYFTVTAIPRPGVLRVRGYRSEIVAKVPPARDLVFSYGEFPAGVFQKIDLPISAGKYRYRTLRGKGWRNLVHALRWKGPQLCSYKMGGSNRRFYIDTIPAEDEIEVEGDLNHHVTKIEKVQVKR